LPPNNAQSEQDQQRRAALRALFAPRHIAVIGASRTPGKIGHSVVHNLIKGGFAGRIFPINAAGGEVEGLACLRSAAELPDAVDCAMLVVPAKETVAAIRACADKGVRSAIIGAVGFAETGTAEGRQRQHEVASLARRAGLRLLGPNTNGITNTSASLSLGYNAVHGYAIAPGPVSIVSHSGALFGGLIRTLEQFGVGLSKFVPVGNEADLDMLDILDYAIEDPDTKVIGLAIEALANGARFRELAVRAKARGKPVVALKVGRSAAGVVAALAHSSRLAGGARAYDALFSACGIASVRSVEALAATCALLARYPDRVTDPRLICVTTSGAAGALLADHAAERGFVLAGDAIGEWQGEAGVAIAAMDSRGHLRNPLDVGALADWPDLARIYQLLERDGLLGPTVCYAHIAPRPEQDATLLAVLRGRKERTREPIVVIAPGGLVPALEQQYRESGIALFHETALGFDVLAAHRAAGAPASFAESLTPSAAARAAAVRLANMHGDVLSEADSADILRGLGVPLVESREATTLAQAQAAADALGYPLVLKAMVPGVAHKNAAGLVITSISNKAELERAHAALTERTQGKADVRVLLQPMLPAKFELIDGAHRRLAPGCAAAHCRHALRVRSPATDPRRAATTDPRRARPDRIGRSQSRHRHQGQRSHGRGRIDCSESIAMTSDSVMAGLVPAIHAFRALPRRKDVDARDKRGHDSGAQLCRGTKS
jgi:acyl-CoA synthetase (NDP forming)